MVWPILISICMIGGRDWPGVDNDVLLCICCWFYFLRCLVPILGLGGWLSVKQMDPVSFSAEIGNLI